MPRARASITGAASFTGTSEHSFSLWLVPDGPARDDLTRTIASLAKRLGTPVFEPHVTLIGRVPLTEEDVVRRARTIALRASPIAVRLGHVAFEDEYFRCCVLVAEGAGLLPARRLAEAVFSLEAAPYAPHVSLIYGSLSPAARDRLRPEIEGLLPIAFDARTLEVWQTKGEVSSWKRLASFSVCAPVPGRAG